MAAGQQQAESPAAPFLPVARPPPIPPKVVSAVESLAAHLQLVE